MSRPPLSEGQLPPLFKKLRVVNEGILCNLIDRAEESGNPGAIDAVEILGSLNNAAARAAKLRHPLKEFLLQNYKCKPDWYKDLSNATSDAPSGSEVSVPLGNPDETEQTAKTPTVEAGNKTGNIEDVQMSATEEVINNANPSTEHSELVAVTANTEMPATSNSSHSDAIHPTQEVETLTSVTTTPVVDRPEGALFRGTLLTMEQEGELQTLFASQDSPLHHPSLTVWLELLAKVPQLHLFGLPINNMSEVNSQLLRGLLAVLRRLPPRVTPGQLFYALEALQTRWILRPGFIPANPQALPIRILASEVNDPNSVIEFFTVTGFIPEEHLDVCALIGHIA